MPPPFSISSLPEHYKSMLKVVSTDNIIFRKFYSHLEYLLFSYNYNHKYGTQSKVPSPILFAITKICKVLIDFSLNII